MSKFTEFALEDNMLRLLKDSKEKVERLYQVSVSFDEDCGRVQLDGEVIDRRNAQVHTRPDKAK